MIVSSSSPSAGYQLAWKWAGRNENPLSALADFCSRSGEVLGELVTGIDPYAVLPDQPEEEF